MHGAWRKIVISNGFKWEAGNAGLPPLMYLSLLILALTACGNQQSEITRLTLTGSSTVAPLMSEIAQHYEQSNPQVRIDVQTGGSSRGINDARQQLADIGMVSRTLKSNEQDLQTATIAWDGISIIVHKDNPVSQLSREQIVDIFTGKLNNWQELGGNSRKIVVINKAEGRSTLELFLKYFKLNNKDIKAHIIIGDNQQGLKTVAGNPNAIGYVSIGAAAYESRLGTAIKLLPMAGINPSLESLEKGEFPLSRPLNLVTVGSRSAAVKQFIDYAQSAAVNDIINKQYFVPANAQQ